MARRGGIEPAARKVRPVNYSLQFGPIWDNRSLIIDGFVTTILLSAAALVLAILIGIAVGSAATARSRTVRAASVTYVESMRNIPLLIHMYFWYNGLSFLKIPAFWCGVFGLSLYSGAYVAEIVRSGIGSVPRGQSQAALASGLTNLQAMLFVVYPQAIRAVIPSLASVFSQLIKDSSLASVIAVADLTYQASAIEGQTFRTFEIYITICLLYLVLVTLVTQTLTILSSSRGANSGQRTADA
jgi:His/Glu/Gln/Arg/opine family amino acid ABC transporter permease subunit